VIKYWSLLYQKYTIETVSKINVVILKPAKNLLLFFPNQKIKRGDPSAYSLKMTKKVKE
jgi:hypothetical protein